MIALLLSLSLGLAQDDTVPSPPAPIEAQAPATAEAEVDAAVLPPRVEPADVLSYLTSVQQLHIQDDLPVWLYQPLVIEDGPVKLTMNNGYITPIWSGWDEPYWDKREGKKNFIDAEHRGGKRLAGFAWTAGEGTVETSFPDRGDAQRFANRMVLDGDMSRESMAAVAKGGKYAVAADRALILAGPTVTTSVFDNSKSLSIITELAEADVELFDDILVQAERIPAARALVTAVQMFNRRMELYEFAELDVPERLALDRTRRDLYDTDRRYAHFIADIHTEQRFPARVVRTLRDGSVNENDPLNGEPAADDDGFIREVKEFSEWMTLTRDDTGEFDTRRRSKLETIIEYGRDGAGRPLLARAPISADSFPPLDPDVPGSPPAPPTRFTHDQARTTINVFPYKKDAMLLRAKIETTLTMTAQGGAEVFRMRVPRGIERYGIPVIVDVTTLDGRSLLIRKPDYEHEEVELALPRGLATGESIQLKVTAEAYWDRIARRYDGSDNMTVIGESTGMHPYLPEPIPSMPGNGWPFDTTLSWPHALGMTGALAGDTVMSGFGGFGIHVVNVAHRGGTALDPWVGFGKWTTKYEEPYQDLPAVRIHLFSAANKQSADQFGPEIRRVVVFYRKYMPGFPVKEMEVVEVPPTLTRNAHGILALKGLGVEPGATLASQARVRNIGQLSFATAVGQQYWGHVLRPASDRDAWISGTMSRGYAYRYTQAAMSEEDRMYSEDAMKKGQYRWEVVLKGNAIRASLTHASESYFETRIVEDYGSFIFFQMLRSRMGDTAFFGAMDTFAREHYQQYVTTEQLQDAFEANTELDLSNFFDFWVYGGFIPELEVRWQADLEAAKPMLTGKVLCDVPFGTVEVPVRITDKSTKSETTIWVDVVDGEGSFEVQLDTAKKPKIELDPDNVMIARARRIRKAKD